MGAFSASTQKRCLGVAFNVKTHIIRDTSDARRFLLQGLWWQRVLPPTSSTVRNILSWAKELVSIGYALPPIGFLADLGHVTYGEDWENRIGRESTTTVPNLPINLLRTYEDHVLGKIYADWTFGRACDALRQYEKGRDQARGLAYLMGQFHERAKFDGVEMSAGVVTGLLDMPAEELLAEGYESLRVAGPHPLLCVLYESLIQSSRCIAEILGPEDIFDLEHKSALEELGQRLAHRQVLQAGAFLEATLPRHKIKPLARRMEVPTKILDEDMYPVGGFTSLSNKGSIESLLHSQLAYMEPQRSAEPDLFDTMFLMDELLYYSRDDNQFMRRRRTFVLVFSSDLQETRFKDSELPYQRGVMLLGLVHTLVRKLAQWLTTDALNFHLVFPGVGEAVAVGRGVLSRPQPEAMKGARGELGASLQHQESSKEPLLKERQLLEKLFLEDIKTGVVTIERLPMNKLPGRCEEWTRRSMVHLLMCGIAPTRVEVRDAVVTRLAINGPRPALGDGTADAVPVEGDDACDSWANILQAILARWV